MEALELKEFREGFGFVESKLTLKKNRFGAYNKKEVEETLNQLKQNCISMQLAFEEKNKTFAQGLARADQEAKGLMMQIEQLRVDLNSKDEQILDYQNQLERLNQTIIEMEERLEEVKHIRNDETLLKENICLQEQIEEDRKQIEALRSSLLEKEELVLKINEELERTRNKAQADLNLAYKSMGFRMDKLKYMIEDFKDVSAEIDKTIQNQLEAIARSEQ